MVDQPSTKKQQQQQLQYQGLKDITVQQSSFEWSNRKWLGQHKSYKRLRVFFTRKANSGTKPEEWVQCGVKEIASFL